MGGGGVREEIIRRYVGRTASTKAAIGQLNRTDWGEG